MFVENIILKETIIKHAGADCPAFVDLLPSDGKSSLCFDSRLIKPMDIFVGLNKGSMYADAAIANGAAFAIVDPRGHSADTRSIVVSDTIKFISDLARAKRALYKGVVIGITGSAGKTTMKEILKHSFKEAGYGVSATIKNFNNHIGLPMSVINADLESAFWVLEIGTNSPGEIAALSSIARPDVSVVINILPAHLEGLGDLKGVAIEKLSIGFNTRGSLFLPLSMRPLLAELGVDVPERAIWAEPDKCVPDGFYGAHWPDMFGLVRAVFESLCGRPFDCSCLLGFRPPEGRFRQVDLNGLTVIDDAYNANPGSVRAAIDAFVEFVKMRGKKHPLLVLGDMMELGGMSGQLHLETLNYALQAVPNAVFIGENFTRFRDDFESARFFPSVEDFLNDIDLLLQDCDAVLFKASHSIGLDRAVDRVLKAYVV